MSIPTTLGSPTGASRKADSPLQPPRQKAGLSWHPMRGVWQRNDRAYLPHKLSVLSLCSRLPRNDWAHLPQKQGLSRRADWGCKGVIKGLVSFELSGEHGIAISGLRIALTVSIKAPQDPEALIACMPGVTSRAHPGPRLQARDPVTAVCTRSAPTLLFCGPGGRTVLRNPMIMMIPGVGDSDPASGKRCNGPACAVEQPLHGCGHGGAQRGALNVVCGVLPPWDQIAHPRHRAPCFCGALQCLLRLAPAPLAVAEGEDVESTDDEQCTRR